MFVGPDPANGLGQWSYDVDFSRANDRWLSGVSQTNADGREMTCMARSVEGTFNQVAAKEYTDTSRIAFQYGPLPNSSVAHPFLLAAFHSKFIGEQ